MDNKAFEDINYREPASVRHNGVAPKTRPITGAIKVRRNAPCICGSGIKAKRCCLPKLHKYDAENRRTMV